MLPEVGREQTPECMAHPGSTIKHWVGGGGNLFVLRDSSISECSFHLLS